MSESVLDATVAGPSANSYLTFDEADALLESIPGELMDKWDALVNEETGLKDQQCQILLEAARLIDQYQPWGPPSLDTQRLKFPRITDDVTVISLQVKNAVVEFIKHVLDGDMADLKKLQKESVTSASILGLSSSFEAEKSELPAGSRRELDLLVRAHWPAAIKNRRLDGSTDHDSFFG